jgi:hypothetical protein
MRSPGEEEFQYSFWESEDARAVHYIKWLLILDSKHFVSSTDVYSELGNIISCFILPHKNTAI